MTALHTIPPLVTRHYTLIASRTQPCETSPYTPVQIDTVFHIVPERSQVSRIHGFLRKRPTRSNYLLKRRPGHQPTHCFVPLPRQTCSTRLITHDWESALFAHFPGLASARYLPGPPRIVVQPQHLDLHSWSQVQLIWERRDVAEISIGPI